MDDSYRFKRLTEAALHKAEESLGHRLPKTFVTLLKKQNGGSIRFNPVRLENVTIHDEPYLELTYLMGVGENLGILDSPWLLEEWEMPTDLILLSGDGHS